jgi:hypothetical protein
MGALAKCCMKTNEIDNGTNKTKSTNNIFKIQENMTGILLEQATTCIVV